MKDFRLGVVGLGHRGRAMFTEACKCLFGIKGVAACDINPALWYDDILRDKAVHPSMASQLPDVKFYESYDEMLEKADLDIVMIETPATCHAEFCIKALDRGIHVFSDIPSVRDLVEAKDLWEAHLRSSAKLMTGATTMGWGFCLSLQDLYHQGLLGKPYALEAEYIHDCRGLWEETPWRKPTTKFASVPCSYSTHSLGPMLAVLEEDLTEVVCISSGSHVTEFPHANDYTCALFRTPSKVTVRMTCSFINNCKSGLHSFRVFGTEGCFEHLSHRGEKQPMRTTFSSNKLVGADAPVELPVGFSPFSDAVKRQYKYKGTFGHGGADSYLWLRFIEALQRGDEVMPISLRDGLRMTLPGIYAVESVIRDGEKVAIHYPWQKEEFQKDIETCSPRCTGRK
ncbi:MAG: Gfo/Idh/MocA family oxidoreductase [Lentisphaeria bacterium]|nr:Gfo/Idh/MocA family oxidoreductase [Lentisphaeria bacterium]